MFQKITLSNIERINLIDMKISITEKYSYRLTSGSSYFCLFNNIKLLWFFALNAVNNPNLSATLLIKKRNGNSF